MVRFAVGLGSNIGDRLAHLDAGLGALSVRWKPVARSSLYESAPVGPVEQAPFLNAVAVFETSQSPTEVLARLLAAEQTRGRTREVRWGPRTLDLDLLLFGDATVAEPGLTVPHPELLNRRFVLEPLLEAWPEATLPDGTRLSSSLPAVGEQHVENVGPWNVSLWRRTWWRLLSSRQ
jgi:2-amino-4-hydroxy-6-hydroxymethyldihydropteridine diphosphokinase